MADKKLYRDILLSEFDYTGNDKRGGKPLQFHNPVSEYLAERLNFNTRDTTLGDMTVRYLASVGIKETDAKGKQLMRMDGTGKELLASPVDDDTLEEISKTIVYAYPNMRHLHTAYQSANFAKMATVLTGVLIPAAAARHMFKTLDDKKMKYEGIELRPVDYVNLAHLGIVGGLLTGYQLCRVLPDTVSSEEHGVNYWRHLTEDVMHSATLAFAEPVHNTFNRELWNGYVMEGLLCVPAPFFATGRPITAAKELVAHVKNTGQEMIVGLYDHIEEGMHSLGHLIPEGVTKLIPGREKAMHLIDAAGATLEKSLERMHLTDSDKAATATDKVRSTKNVLGAAYGERRKFYEEGLTKSRASILAAGLADIVNGGMMTAGGPHLQNARLDIIYAVLQRLHPEKNL